MHGRLSVSLSNDSAQEADRGVRIFQSQLDGIADYWICYGN